MEYKYIAEGYDSVRLFNALAGNLSGVTDESVDNQLSFIFSELTEAIDGFEAGDKVELLDGACDLFVTVTGLMQKLEAQGYNVKEALARVNENNLSKFPITPTISDVEKYTVTSIEGTERFVLKNEIGKIMKPSTFVSVDLKDLVPQ